MALIRDISQRDLVSATRPTGGDRLIDDMHETDTGRSNFVAFLLGGVVISGGLLAFLFYDTGALPPTDDLTTGSIMREAPARPLPSIRIPVQPQQPTAP